MAIKVAGTTVIDDSRNLTNIQSINTTVSATELSYLDGVTSSIQTQLNGKASSSHNHNADNITTGTLPVARGGTGAATLTGLVKGNGTGAMTAAVAGTDYVVPSGSITGNAATATKLATARTIDLSGDVTGSVSFDGSANATITATVVDDSHNHVIANVDGLQDALNLKAPLASPALTGTPTAPTAAAGTNTTQLATTAFVNAEIANDAVAKDSNTGAALLPSGTTAQRPTGGAAKLRFNTDLSKFEGHNGSAWGSLGGATGGGNDAVFYLNGQTVTTNFTIPAGQNAMSAGPITVADGVIVTVSNGSNWVVV